MVRVKGKERCVINKSINAVTIYIYNLRIRELALYIKESQKGQIEAGGSAGYGEEAAAELEAKGRGDE